MATLANTALTSQPAILDVRQGKPPQGTVVSPIVKPRVQRVIPVKIGFMGEQGSGKTSTAALLATAIAVEHHNRGPIYVTDPELGWQFLNSVIFSKEKIRLVQKTVPTFQAMLRDMRDAEKEGAAVWAVELGKIWTEILRTLQRNKPDNWGSELVYMWTDFVAQFLNLQPHCLVLGRIQDIIEDVLNENGKVQSIKVGEGLKAGGQKNNFGYEPHLVIRMKLETKPRVRKGKQFEEDGRSIHWARVMKDRTWALNGQVFRWPDRDGYKAGDYKYVWQSLKPHFTATQESGEAPKLDTISTSEALVETDNNGEFYRERERREKLGNEIKATLDLFFGGTGREDRQVRIAVTDLIFGVKDKENAAKLGTEKLERGLRILHTYEKLPERHMDSQQDVLSEVADCVAEYDRGESEEWEVPF